MLFAEDWTDPASIASGATVAIAILTMALAWETYLLRCDQTKQLEEMRRQSIKPSVDVYVVPEKSSGNQYCVQLANDGVGIAKNIKINILPYTNPEDSVKEAFVNGYLKNQYESIPFIAKGVQTLGIRSSRQFMFDTSNMTEAWCNHIEHITSEYGVHFSYAPEVKIKFEDINGYPYKTSGVIDLSDKPLR